MATANEDIRDALIRRQLQVLRDGKALGLRLRQLLDKSERELRSDITDRLERLAQGRVTFGKTTTDRLRSMRKAIQRLLETNWAEIREEASSSLGNIGRKEVAFAADAITSSLPVIPDLALPSSTDIQKIITSRPFQGKILSKWVQDLEFSDRRRMLEAIQIGMIQGETSTQIGNRVFGTAQLSGSDGVRAISRRGLQAIANTAVNHIANQSKQALYLKNKRLIPEELFVATLDSSTTNVCKKNDGEVFEVGKGPIPPLHFNERSLRTPVVDGAELGNRPANRATAKSLEGLRGPQRREAVKKLVGQVPGKETYEQFLRKSNVSFQNEALGQTRSKLFRDGGLPLSALVNSSGRNFNLQQLRRRNPEAFVKAGID